MGQHRDDDLPVAEAQQLFAQAAALAADRDDGASQVDPPDVLCCFGQRRAEELQAVPAEPIAARTVLKL